MSRNKTINALFSVFANNFSIIVDKNGGKRFFAETLGVSYDAVRQWCNGENLPAGPYLLKISERFNVSIDWLLTGKDPGETFMEQWPEEIRELCQKIKKIAEANDPIVLSGLFSYVAAAQVIVEREAELQKELDTLKKKIRHLEKLHDSEKLTGID